MGQRFTNQIRSRRSILRTGGAALVGALSGRSRFRSDRSSQLTLGFRNFDDDSHELDIELLRPAGDSSSDARALARVFEVPARNEDGAATIRERDAVETNR